MSDRWNTNPVAASAEDRRPYNCEAFGRALVEDDDLVELQCVDCGSVVRTTIGKLSESPRAASCQFCGLNPQAEQAVAAMVREFLDRVGDLQKAHWQFSQSFDHFAWRDVYDDDMERRRQPMLLIRPARPAPASPTDAAAGLRALLRRE